MNEDFPKKKRQRRSKLYPLYKAARAKKRKVTYIADSLLIDGVKYDVNMLDKLPPDMQIKKQAERQIKNSILFYGMDSCFSNFYPTQLELGSVKYNSSLQYYLHERAKRTGDQVLAQKILDSTDPREQHRLSKKLVIDEVTWNSKIAKAVMETGVKAKFEQNAHLLKLLQASGNKDLIECDPHNNMWSCGLRITDDRAINMQHWKGENALGTILRSVRDGL
jgi:ribA/ribD-fused uncharacterized protein